MKSKKFKTISIALLIAGILLFSAFISFVGNNNSGRTNAATADGQGREMRVVGYLPTWSYAAYKDIDFSTLTHINISFCNVNSSGNIACGIPDNEMTALVKKAHDNNVKIMAALGGGGDKTGYGNMITSADKIKSLNEKIVTFCEKYDLDGVDLDIELDSSDSIWKDYGNWITELRAVCDERDWLLSTATAQWVAYSTSPETFAKFDYINVMAYDNESRGATSHSTYEFAVECLDFFHNTKQIPKEKLVLGVPFYGYEYDSNGNMLWDSYSSFAQLIEMDVANYDRDKYNSYGYNGASTMRRKCELAKDYGGIMIWEITQDAPGEFSLLSVIKEEIFPDTPVNAPSDKPDDDVPVEPDNDSKDNTLTITIVLSVIGGLAAIAATTLTVTFVVRRKKKNKLK